MTTFISYSFLRAIVLAIVLAIILAGANTYLGLFAGMTLASAIPAAVVSMGVLREIHRWGAHAMVITVMLHMYRVFLTGSYKPPREFNWVIGVILLLLFFPAYGQFDLPVLVS